MGPQTDAEILELFGEEPLLVSTLEKDTCKTREESLLEIYRKLRPGEPPTLDSAETLINGLFFDARRYDLSAVGRYKFNKKLSLWPRLSGQKLAAPVADPRTGEILAEAGQTLTRAQAQDLENHGVSEAFVDVDGQVVKVFSNRMVDMAHFVSFDPEACGITEKVRFEVLCELLDQCGGDEAALQELVAERKDDLVPKHIIVDDIMASINYLCSLSHGVGTPDDIDHLGRRPPPSRSSSGPPPCPSLWTRPTLWQSSPTSGVCPPWAPAACPVTGPPSTSVTSTTATTAVCAPLRPRKAPTSA